MKVLLIGSGRKLKQEITKISNEYPNENLEFLSVDKLNSRVQNYDKCCGPAERDYDYRTTKDYNPKIKKFDMDIFEFLENYTEKDIDLVEAIRVFEHIEYENIPYLLYLLSEVCSYDATLKVVVPDFYEISKEIIGFENGDINNEASDFNRKMINFHTELFNTIDDPHRSIWTEKLIYYYMELEKFWKIDTLQTRVSMDNRDWYLKFSCKNTKL